LRDGNDRPPPLDRSLTRFLGNKMTAIIAKIQDFIRLESTSGVLLMFAALLALLAANSMFADFYGALLSTTASITIGAFEINKPLLLWINDGLMAVFFFLVGLEIKRETLQGELSSVKKATLPVFAAIGGIAAPALIFALINAGDPATLRGWAIPAATDIAFALGVLALIGTRAPTSLKIFLLAIAIIDDLAAVIIIALFYTGDLSAPALLMALIGVAGLVALNRLRVTRITPYALIGAFIWVCVLKSGVHATLAGVVTALAIPIAGKTKDAQSPLHRLEHGLHPWVAFMVLPIFAFANAGVSFAGASVDAILAPLPLGVALGLLIGKPLGVLAMSWLAVRLGLAALPKDANWLQVTGLACLTGIGFTMSLFIGSLAFATPEAMNAVRMGVFAGSLGSALIGAAILIAASSKASLGEKAPDAKVSNAKTFSSNVNNAERAAA